MGEHMAKGEYTEKGHKIKRGLAGCPPPICGPGGGDRPDR